MAVSLRQDEQDRIWRHHQTVDSRSFELSYPRLRFFAARFAPGTRVLNIGVGTGHLEELLAARGVEVYALDPSAETIALLQRKVNMGDRARHGYGQEMPFDTAMFDAVIMTEVLEHLPTPVLQATVREVHRVLKPGGEFTGSVPYQEDLASGEVLCPRCGAQFHRWGHEQRFDTPGLRQLLEGAGFRVDRIYPRAFPDFNRRGARLLLKAVFRYLLGRLGEPLVGPNLYFRAHT